MSQRRSLVFTHSHTDSPHTAVLAFFSLLPKRNLLVVIIIFSDCDFHYHLYNLVNLFFTTSFAACNLKQFCFSPPILLTSVFLSLFFILLLLSLLMCLHYIVIDW